MPRHKGFNVEDDDNKEEGNTTSQVADRNAVEEGTLTGSFTAWMSSIEALTMTADDSLEIPMGGSAHATPLPIHPHTSRTDWFTDEDGDMFSSPEAEEDLCMNTNTNNNEGSLNSFALPMDLDSNSYQDSFDENDLGVELLNDIDIQEERPKSIRFADTVATPFGEVGNISSGSDGCFSLDTTDIFDIGKPLSYSILDEESEGSIDLGIHDDDSEMGELQSDNEDDDQKTMKRSMMWAAGGMGAMAIFGWAMGKLQKVFEKEGDEDDVAAAAQRGGDVGTETQDVVTLATGDPGTSLSASTANASQSQSFFAAGVLPGDGGVSMSAAQ